MKKKKHCFKNKECEISKSYNNNEGIPFYLIGNAKYQRCKFSVIIKSMGSYYCCHFKPSKGKTKLLGMYEFIEKNNEFVEIIKGKDDEKINKIMTQIKFLNMCQ